VGLVERIDFTGETISSPGNNFPNSLKYDWAAVSSDSYGYFGGGPGSFNVDIDRIDFINETTTGYSDHPGELSSARYNIATASSNSYGYFVGGITFPSPPNVTTIDRIDFSNETMSLPGNNLPGSGRYSAAGVSGGASTLRGKGFKTYGYFGGGKPAPAPFSNTISRLDFSNETVSNPGNNLPTARSNIAATSNNSYGYFGGGYSPTIISTISRLDFINETLSDLGNNLPTARYALAATSSSSYGYFGGGFSPPNINTISRLDFTNETTSDPGNNLPTARRSLAATSSSSYGYFGGGRTPTIINTITRLDFSSETLSDPGNNLPTARSNIAATSNSN
jgi:hypothetical protein